MSRKEPVKNALQNTSAETVDVVLPIALIDGHERNYNQHPEAQVKRLAKSVEKFSQVRGVVGQWQPSGRYLCLAGHGVLAGMKMAGKETARVALVPDSWSPAKCLAYLAADNELGRGAVADQVALEALVQDVALSDEDLAMLAAGSEEAYAKLAGRFDAAEVEPPALKDGDRAPFQQMTFTLHDEQAETISQAVAAAKEAGHGESAVNENSNGNALAWVALEFIRGLS